jgi:ABC-type polysaccharide/polyol phosphate transport system ATPase subunit
MSPPRPAILVDGLSKSFQLPREHVHTLKEKALHPLRRAEHDTLRALRNVSFAVEPGEFFGVVGRNGSGKSTLLKCLAGIYRADAGRIYVDGRISTFIELGVGFNPDLAAYDNVLLNATMLGLSPREARRRFDRIIEFAELEDFVDLKLKNYSSGMMVRLAFAVMIQVDASILIIDEVLAVGDAAFQQKCFEEFARIRDSGATVLLVTHDMTAVQRFCDRAMLLENGRRVDLGDTEHVAGRYLQLNFSEQAREMEKQSAQLAEGGEPVADEPTSTPAEPMFEEEERLGDGKAEIVEAWFENGRGEPVDVVEVQERAVFCARVRFHERLQDPLFGVSLFNPRGDYVFGANNVRHPKSGTFDAGEDVVFSVRFDAFLAPDRYWATPVVAREQSGVALHDRRGRLVSVMVTATRRAGEGLLEVPFELEVQRTNASAHKAAT